MTEKILLLGNNALTAGIAQDLIDLDVDLVFATRDRNAILPAALTDVASNKKKIQVLTESRVTACTGSVGNFTIQLNTNQQKQSLQVSQVVLSLDAEQQLDYGVYGLQPATAILTLTEIEKMVSKNTKSESAYSQAQTVAFLVGLFHETTPENTRRAMKLAQLSQEAGKQAYILTGNLKVGDHGLEQLYRLTRDIGVILIKFSHTRPRTQIDESGQVVIEFDDEVAGRPFRLTPDLTVLDEVSQPTTYLKDLIEIFELEADPSGFAQADNVHRIGVGTNRAGILVTGPAKNVLGRREHRMDMAAVGLRGSLPVEPSDPESLNSAEIDVGSCIRCLTCHRMCPHGAIQVNTRVQVLSRACEACGLCAAECPREAIQLPGMNGFNMGSHMAEPKRASKDQEYTPTILTFCCSRSALPASRLAKCLSQTMPNGLKIIEIPCAGSLSLEHLLTGFRLGADGTLVLTCHSDNCHARHGNQRALERVELLQNQFANIGFEKERLHFATLASNMGMAFAEIVTEFEKKLRGLGPSRLK